MNTMHAQEDNWQRAEAEAEHAEMTRRIVANTNQLQADVRGAYDAAWEAGRPCPFCLQPTSKAPPFCEHVPEVCPLKRTRIAGGQATEVEAAYEALKEAGRMVYDAWNQGRSHVNKMLGLGKALVAIGVKLAPENASELYDECASCGWPNHDHPIVGCGCSCHAERRKEAIPGLDIADIPGEATVLRQGLQAIKEHALDEWSRDAARVALKASEKVVATHKRSVDRG